MGGGFELSCFGAKPVFLAFGDSYYKAFVFHAEGGLCHSDGSRGLRGVPQRCMVSAGPKGPLFADQLAA